MVPNEPQGIEQGFTLDERPGGQEDKPLLLDLALLGDLVPRVVKAGNGVDFSTPGGMILSSVSSVVDSSTGTLPAGATPVRSAVVRTRHVGAAFARLALHLNRCRRGRSGSA